MRPAIVRGLLVTLLLGGVCACMRTQPGVEYAPLRHPFRGAELFLDSDTLARQWQVAHSAAWLDPITSTPQARWLTGPDDLAALGPVVREAGRQRKLLVVVAYHIPNRDCAGQGAASADDYRAWIGQLVDVLASTRAVVVLEPDAVAADCFDQTRARILAGAVRELADAGHYVYLDAGHPNWRPPAEMAPRLHAAGIAAAEGFSVNVSNRRSTADSQRFAAELSAQTGGREALIDTSRNGLPAPPDDQWCNPAQQGLGQRPTVQSGLDRVAALLWVKRPGESDGPCGEEPSADAFSPRQARTLIVNAAWVPEPTRQKAASARLD